MKAVALKNFTFQDGLYSVGLGNGTYHSFTSKKQVLKFLVSTNHFLTIKLHELNFIYSDLFSLYRSNWLFFKSHINSPAYKTYNSESIIKELLTSINSSLEIAYERSYSENSNYFVFSHLFNVCSYSKQIAINIKNLNKTKSYTSSVLKCDFIIKQIISIESELKNYSITTASDYSENINSDLSNVIELLNKKIS